MHDQVKVSVFVAVSQRDAFDVFWSTLPADHPLRHGAPADEFMRVVGRWWSWLMTSLREHVRER